MRTLRTAALALLVVAPVLASHPVHAQQNIVYPQTAGQNQVRWDKFNWVYVDLLKSPETGAGVRLYFYEDERAAAERAAAAIEEEYAWLIEQFDYRPQIQVPYILYNSHGELEQTNLFQIGEGTLGVTSPEDLKMTAAYWGDHQRFRHVSLHEMVHQFTIQKVNGVAEKAKAYGTPLQKMPLWFIEGLAEYYSIPDGIDAETEQYMRDLVANPDPWRGYVLPPFLSDDMRSFVYTYKLGQIRVYFLAETYGKAKLQEMLSTSYRLRGWRKTMANGGVSPDPPETQASRSRDRVLEFDELLERVTGDPMDKIQAKWEDWIKRRYYQQYLDATQKYSDYREADAARFYPDTFAVSPDGDSMIYRGIEPVTGTTRLFLVDPRDPLSGAQVVEDGRPGVDTLHYSDRPVADLNEKYIAYIARDGDNDVLRIVEYTHSARDNEEGNKLRTRARFRVSGTKLTFDPGVHNLKEMGAPAFSPDGKKLAVIGLDKEGVTDVWTLELATAKWTKLTNDPYAEKELDWSAQGIVYSADATETRHYNLFLVNPDTQEVRRLTQAAANHRFPAFTPDGATVAFSGDDSSKWDIYQLSMAAALQGGPKSAEAAATPAPAATPETTASPTPIPPTATAAAAEIIAPVSATTGLARVTDFPTGLSSPTFTGARMYALGMKGGKYRVFSIERSNLLTVATPYPALRDETPWAIPSKELDGERAYSVLSGDAWQLEQAFATIGGSTGIYGGGFLFFSDRMRDRTVYVVAQAYGRADLTDAQAVYIDRTRRVGWGVATFLSPQPVIDPEYSDSSRVILFMERKFGAAAILEYPFNRYMRVGGSLGLAGTDRFIPDFYDIPEFGYGFGNDVTGREAWERENEGIQPEIDSSISIGFDTLTQSWETGPLDGNSLLATLSTYYQPTRQSWFGDVTVDAQHYIRLYKTVNLGLRGAWGQSFGDEWKRPFYVSSVDNLRGVPWYQFNYLTSEAYALGGAELQIPLDGLIRLLIFQNIEGIGGIDAGSLFSRYEDFDENRTAAFVTGFNFNLAIFQFRLHFAKSFDIGGIKPGEPREGETQPIVPDGWVTNFTIRYLFF